MSSNVLHLDGMSPSSQENKARLKTMFQRLIGALEVEKARQELLIRNKRLDPKSHTNLISSLGPLLVFSNKIKEVARQGPVSEAEYWSLVNQAKAWVRETVHDAIIYEFESRDVAPLPKRDQAP